MYSTEFLNKNQYVFIQQTNTTGVIVALKYYVQEVFSKSEITAIVRLDLPGAFISIWAPSVLKNYKKAYVHETSITSKNITSAKEEKPW